jgi:TorA maturation chaperone TorD
MKSLNKEKDPSSELSLTDKDLSVMANARSGMYDFLAGLCAKPSKKTVEAVLNYSFDPHNDASLPVELKKALETFKKHKPKPEEDLATELQVEWTKLFRGVAKGYSPPPPYESVYMEGVLQGKATRTLSRTYAEHGVRLSGDSTELPDYIGVEFKFMSALASKEAEAWGIDRSRALELIGAQKQFARAHLQSWIPRFCAEVERVATTDFYRATAQLMRAVLEWDVCLLDSIEQTASNLS